MNSRITPVLLAMVFASANALAPSETLGRRGFVGALVGGSVTAALVASPQQSEASSAKTGAASVFTGEYDDPNHPGCLRQVKVVGAPMRGDGTRSAFPVVEIKGYDGKGGEGGPMCTDRPTRADIWSVQGKLLKPTEASLDFSPKGGPTNLLGKFEDGGIVFPDGNKWTKVVAGTPNRYPADMSTLKSN